MSRRVVLEAALHEALTAQAAYAKAKNGTEGEARDAAKASLRWADMQVTRAKGALKQHWMCCTADKLYFEVRETRQIYAEAQSRAGDAIQQARGGAAARHDERCREADALAREESEDTRRALDGYVYS